MQINGKKELCNVYNFNDLNLTRDKVEEKRIFSQQRTKVWSPQENHHYHNYTYKEIPTHSVPCPCTFVVCVQATKEWSAYRRQKNTMISKQKWWKPFFWTAHIEMAEMEKASKHAGFAKVAKHWHSFLLEPMQTVTLDLLCLVLNWRVHYLSCFWFQWGEWLKRRQHGVVHVFFWFFSMVFFLWLIGWASK